MSHISQDFSYTKHITHSKARAAIASTYEGHVDVAGELLEHCPDAPYHQTNGYTCLHHAVRFERTEFVKFVLDSPLLCSLVNIGFLKDCSLRPGMNVVWDSRWLNLLKFD